MASAKRGEERPSLKKGEVWKFKKYLCKARCFDLSAGGKIIVLNENEANQNDIYASHRVVLRTGKKEIVAIVDLSNELVSKGEVGLFSEVHEDLGVSDGHEIEVVHMHRPASIEYIKKKMDGGQLSKQEMHTIMSELMQNYLSDAELASFITSVYIRGMSPAEVVGLTESVVATGQTLGLGLHPICDKHCIGGVAGNRTTMLVVPIVAAAGLYIPKTSSRSITSAAGTADTMEVLCSVSLEIEEMREIVRKAHGCVVWGGALQLASADDRLIKIRNPLSLDPRCVMLASILAKKKSVGAEHVIIDIPIGKGAKIANEPDAKRLGEDFMKIGKMLGMNLQVAVTDGSAPIGNGTGPSLECIDVLSALNNAGPNDLLDKSCMLAGRLFEMVGKAAKGKGALAARRLVTSGKALEKFREIVELQGGKRNIRLMDLPQASYWHKVQAERSGKVIHIDNKMISKVARAAGAPNDKTAGVLLKVRKGERVERNYTIFEIHSNSEKRLDFAIKVLDEWNPVWIK